MKIIAALLGAALLLTSCGAREEGPQESLLKNKDREFIREKTAGMEQAVRLVLFTAEKDCEYCELTAGFLEDLASLSPAVTLEVLSLERDAARAEELGIDKAPGIAVLGGKDYGIRYYGLPTGYEFATFAETIRRVADGDPGLSEESVKALGALEHPVTVTVFSTKS